MKYKKKFYSHFQKSNKKNNIYIKYNEASTKRNKKNSFIIISHIY